MDREHQNRGNLTSSGYSNLTKSSGRSSRFSNLFEQVHSASILHFISALLQVGLSLGVVFISVSGLIQPFWVSALMSMFASVTCMAGLYLLYSVTHSGYGHEQLIRDAIRRIMNAQN